MSVSPRPLYLMIKPPRAVARAIASDVRWVSVFDRLHMTLLPLGDRRSFSDVALAELINEVAQLQFFAFRLVFDRVHDWGSNVTLRGSEPIEGALTFQGALRAALVRQGVGLDRYDFDPHITLDYRGGRGGRGGISPILPVSWVVEDFCLIESVHGEARHIEHARFALLPPLVPAWAEELALAA